MSDSGSDTDREEVPLEKKLDRELVGVAEEGGLLNFGEEQEDEDEEEEEPSERNKKDSSRGKKANGEDKESSESGSDEDQEKTIVLLLPKKATKIDHVAAKKRAVEDAVAGVEAKKAKLEAESGSKDFVPKGSSLNDILNEQTVTRYLQRNPHTTKDLVSKFKSKCGNIDKNEIAPRLAKILKKISPQRFRQK